MRVPSRVRVFLLAIGWLCPLTACTVGPDFTAPDPALPAMWHEGTESVKPAATKVVATGHSTAPIAPAADAPATSALTSTPPDPSWWQVFGDPVLTQLVERATKDNLSLQEAVVRIAEARAGEMSAAAAGLPHLSAKGSYARTQEGIGGLAEEKGGSFGSSSGSGTSSQQVSSLLKQISQPVDLYTAALDASWEIDLFGKVRRSVEAAGAETDQAVASRDDAMVTVEAEVAQTYARLRGAEVSRDTAEEDIAAQRDLLELTQQRAKFGLTSQLDVENETAQVNTTEAQLPQYDAQIESSKDALCVLVGAAPGALDETLASAAPIPPTPPEVPVGLPASLARRRPDIRMSEAKLHEQTADVGVAVASLFPDVSLAANVGQRALKATDLTKWANNFYSVGPSVSLPIFQGGSLVANIRLTKAEQAEATLDYTRTVISALSEINDAMVAYRTEQLRRASLDASVTADRDAVSFARDRYLHGLSTFIDVLTAETNLDQARQALITSTLTESTDLVQLYKALGGGWQSDNDKASAPS